MMETCKCGGTYQFSGHCGAHVCLECSHHKGLARCYCGWAASGGDGRRELVDMGETIEPDEGYVNPADVTVSSDEYMVTGITRRHE